MRKLRIFESDDESLSKVHYSTHAKIHRNLILSGLWTRLIAWASNKTANEHCALLLAVNLKIKEKCAQLHKEMNKLMMMKQWLESLYHEDTPNLPSHGHHMMIEDEDEGEAVSEGENREKQGRTLWSYICLH